MYDFNVLKDLNENTSKTHYISNQVNLKLEYRILEELMFSTSGTFFQYQFTFQIGFKPGLVLIQIQLLDQIYLSREGNYR